MPITITQSKAAKAQQLPKVEDYQDPAKMSDEELADRYGTLQDQISSLTQNPLYAQFDLVSKELSARLAKELKPTDTAEIKGTHWLLEIGTCAKTPRKLNDNATMTVIALLGIEAAGQLAKFNLSDLEKYLTPEQLAQVVNGETSYTDRRKIAAKYLG